MQVKNVAFSLAAAAAFVKADLTLDDDNIPTQCNAVCRPIYELGRICEVDDDVIRDDLTEDLLEAQCVCTNDSFDVSMYAGLCASCIDQNTRDRGNLDDIDDILKTCGFTSTTSYAATASYASSTPSVQATRPTASAQLTTTIVAGAGRTPGAGDGITPKPPGGGPGGGTMGTTTTAGGSQSTDNPNAAGMVSPKGALGLVGAVAAGALIL